MRGEVAGREEFLPIASHLQVLAAIPRHVRPFAAMTSAKTAAMMSADPSVFLLVASTHQGVEVFHSPVLPTRFQ